MRLPPTLLKKFLLNIFIKIETEFSFHILHMDQDTLHVNIQELTKCGYEPTYDTKFVENAETFAADIMDELEECGIFCFLSSAHSNASRHCRREIYIADSFKIPLVLIELDPAPLHKEVRYFFAGIETWQSDVLLKQSLCTYIEKVVSAQVYE